MMGQKLQRVGAKTVITKLRIMSQHFSSPVTVIRLGYMCQHSRWFVSHMANCLGIILQHFGRKVTPFFKAVS